MSEVYADFWARLWLWFRGSGYLFRMSSTSVGFGFFLTCVSQAQKLKKIMTRGFSTININ